MDEEYKIQGWYVPHGKAVVYTGFRGWRGPGSNWGGVLFDIGEIKNVEFFQTRKSSKNVKKSMKIL